MSFEEFSSKKIQLTQPRPKLGVIGRYPTLQADDLRYYNDDRERVERYQFKLHRMNKLGKTWWENFY